MDVRFRNGGCGVFADKALEDEALAAEGPNEVCTSFYGVCFPNEVCTAPMPGVPESQSLDVASAFRDQQAQITCLRNELGQLRRRLADEMAKVQAQLVQPAAAKQMCQEGGDQEFKGSDDAGNKHLEKVEPDTYELRESVWDAMLITGQFTGSVDTAMMLLVSAAAAALQIFFTYIWFTHYTSPAIDETVLDGLRDWRVIKGHHMDYYDLVTNQTLVQRVCAQDVGLALATSQMALLADMDAYLPRPHGDDIAHPGPIVTLMAVLLWILAICGEIREIMTFTQSVLALPREHRTRIEDVDGGGHRFASVSQKRLASMLLLVSLPRLGIAIFLGITGAEYLCYITNMADLIKDAMALAFVLDLDELFFKLLVPRMGRLAVALIQPLPLHQKSRRRQADWHVIATCVVTLFVMVVVHSVVVSGVKDNMAAAQEILCGGDTTIVYLAHSPQQDYPYGKLQIARSNSGVRSGRIGHYYTLWQELGLTGIDIPEDTQLWPVSTTCIMNTGEFYDCSTVLPNGSPGEFSYCCDSGRPEL